ncbi:MAG: hypothetical protein U0792_14930 [Gemmataceae bacterium]
MISPRVFHFCDSVATLAFFMFVFRHVIQYEPAPEVEDEGRARV